MYKVKRYKYSWFIVILLCCLVVVFVNLKLYIMNVSKYVDIGIDFLKWDLIFLFDKVCFLIIGMFESVL